MEEKGLWQQEGSIYMARCPKCGRENYTPNVLTGICAWCGYNANKHAEELGFNNTRISEENPDGATLKPKNDGTPV